MHSCTYCFDCIGYVANFLMLIFAMILGCAGAQVDDWPVVLTEITVSISADTQVQAEKAKATLRHAALKHPNRPAIRTQ